MRIVRKEIGASIDGIEEYLEFSNHMGVKTRFAYLRKWKVIEVSQGKDFIKWKFEQGKYIIPAKNQGIKEWKWKTLASHVWKRSFWLINYGNGIKILNHSWRESPC